MIMEINNAIKTTEDVYKDLSVIVDDVVSKASKNLDKLVKDISNVDILTNDELRKYMMQISIEAFDISKFRDQSSLKEACANALYKEGIANSFNTLSGTVEARKNSATSANMDKQLVNILYSNVSDRLKGKVDEAHRLANMLSSVLISRQAEAKLQYSPRSEINLNTGEIF